jgi:toxin YoeB
MKVEWTPKAREDYDFWVRSNRGTQRLDQLIANVKETPFEGLGHPELMKFEPFVGCWSRRITQEHRLVYRVRKDVIQILQCRYHY